MPGLLLLLCLRVIGQEAAGQKPWWGQDVEASLDRLPDRKIEWGKVLTSTPVQQRAGIAFLMQNLPLRDLKELRSETLTENVALAYQARAAVPWGRAIPEEIFLDAVLPHASVTERREPMRSEWFRRYLPVVVSCATPGEAAMRLNKRLFADHGVRYNTRRVRPDQSSRESIAQGVATCTGLAIMLVEACRAVGVPARLAGIAAWPGRGGNHTWVEVWDGGWHFVGAAEPDEKGLDHAWFAEEAGGAIKDVPDNAIFAVTYRATDQHFPLVWDPQAKVNAENVTDRYRREKAPGLAAGKQRLFVEVAKEGERVEAAVSVLDRLTGTTILEGRSLGPGSDVNRHLGVEVSQGKPVLIAGRLGSHGQLLFTTAGKDAVVRLDIDRPRSSATQKAIVDLLAGRFGLDEGKRSLAAKLLSAVPFEEGDRAAVWNAYRTAPSHAGLRKEFDNRTVSTSDRTSPCLWRTVGPKPATGWALVIAMHGGGGAPKTVNDSQWHSMFESYYREQAEVRGYIYLALRAPNDEWNGFYDDSIAPLIERLILQFVLFAEVDPDRVFILGASHGGYGAFVIGPKIPDRFAAIHASASAPTDGETMGENLRNTRFTFMVGSEDTAYGRAERCRKFAARIQEWKARYGAYPGGFEWKPGVGHSVPDRDKVAEMLTSGARNPWPNHVVWVQSDNVLKRFYWIEAPGAAEGARVEAVAKGHSIKVTASGQDRIWLWLDRPLLDFGEPVSLTLNGGPPRLISLWPSLETYCAGLEQRGDPRLTAPVRIQVAP